jgi:hypothetical protein
MDNKELIYDQFFGENTMTYVELKNRTAGRKYDRRKGILIDIFC